MYSRDKPKSALFNSLTFLCFFPVAFIPIYILIIFVTISVDYCAGLSNMRVGTLNSAYAPILWGAR